MKKTLPLTIRRWIAEDPRSVKGIAEAADIPQPSLQCFASGQRDMTGEPLGRLIDALGGEVTPPKKRKPRRST